MTQTFTYVAQAVEWLRAQLLSLDPARVYTAAREAVSEDAWRNVIRELRTAQDTRMGKTPGLAEFAPNGEAFITAVREAPVGSDLFGAALQGVSTLLPDPTVDVALFLDEQDKPGIGRRDLALVLTRSRRDDALERLLKRVREDKRAAAENVMHPAAVYVIGRSVHPDAGRRILELLQDARVLEFEPHVWWTHRQLAGKPKAEVKAIVNPPEGPAMGYDLACELIRAVGQARYSPARADLERLAAGHPGFRKRERSMAALGDLGDPSAITFLEQWTDDVYDYIGKIAWRAIEALDHPGWPERVRRALSEDALSAGGGLESALALFVYFGDVRRYGYGPVSPLAIELATKLRDHRKLGKTARDLLRSRLINA